ncbi:MAG: cell envelope-related transcriptional attenuator [uncultured bacterium]
MNIKNTILSEDKKLLPKIGFGVLIFLILLNTWQIFSVKNQLAETYQATDDAQQATSLIEEFANDLNEVRGVLLLPEKDYSLNEEEVTEQTEEDPLISNLATYIADLAKSKEYSQKKSEMDAYFASETFKALLANNNLANPENTYNIQNANGLTIMSISLSSDGVYGMEDYFGEVELSENTTSNLTSTIESTLANLQELTDRITTSESARTSLKNILYSAGTTYDAMRAKGISADNEIETDTGFSYDIINQDQSLLASIGLAKDLPDAIMWYNASTGEKAHIAISQEELSAKIADLDGSTALQNDISDKKEKIESMLQDAGFLKILEESSLSIATAREDDNGIYYDITDDTGTLVKTIYIDKHSGKVMVSEPDGTSSTELSAAVTDNTDAQKKNLNLPASLPDEYHSAADAEGAMNMLILGKNGSNVDTIIFANVNPDQQKVTMISIPRDLFYEDRKINSVYALFGMDEFISQIEEITGREVDHYILVDMYVFADIIDLMGGIDITLEEDLIDPSYATYDNGVWSTLYYPAGDYHLNGTQTLRVARSRHYSSDYDRAARQQMILEAIKEKALSMEIADAGTLFGIMKTVLEDTETDIGMDLALTYYVKYKNYSIERGNVMSTVNVLASEHEYVDYNTSAAEEVCDETTGVCETKNFVYILTPYGGNWDYIKWYFDETLN